MKLLFDLFPVILFFAVFKYGEGHPDWAAAFASELSVWRFISSGETRRRSASRRFRSIRAP